MKQPELSLVIPFYNDSGCSIPFVNELKKELRDIDYELILVDDCSKDSTPEELMFLKSKRVKVILNKKNKNYGGAIMTGFSIAKGNILGFSCGDGEVSPKDIVRIYKNMGGKDVIKAIRKNRKDGFNRKIISKVFNFLGRIRFGLNLEDVNGYPVYFKREVYKKLDDLRTDWIFNTDMLRKMIKEGYKIRGVTIQHRKRSGSKSNMTPRRIANMVWGYVKYK